MIEPRERTVSTAGDRRTGPIRTALRDAFARRPWWMNALFGFCLYMTFVYMPFDVFIKPVSVDDEVWFGVKLHGWAAKATEPLHWLIYALGAYGFFGMRRWMWPWASLYVAQIAIGMLVWNVLDPRGAGWPGGLVAAAVFAIPTIALWRARGHFASREDGRAESSSASR